MTITSVYPVLVTADVATTAAFYREHFEFDVTFESDWYVSLGSAGGELAVLAAGHPTIPVPSYGASGGGVIVNIEVDDVDDVYRRLVDGGAVDVVLPLRSEAFGQRHFILSGPDGVLIDVITPIEPDEAFAAQFAAPA